MDGGGICQCGVLERGASPDVVRQGPGRQPQQQPQQQPKRFGGGGQQQHQPKTLEGGSEKSFGKEWNRV